MIFSTTIKQKLKATAVAMALLAGFFIATALPLSVAAETTDHSAKCGVNFNLDGNGTCATTQDSCNKNNDPKSSCDNLDEKPGDSLTKVISQVVDILSVAVGVVAVIMIIIGGFKYVTSGGDSNKVASAKSTIIYAIVGLVIVALSQVIVGYVISRVL